MASHPITGVIDTFDGPYRFLSNFGEHPVEFDGRLYPTSEHAYAAAKTTDTSAIDRIIAAGSPGEAKRLGGRVTLRPNWDTVRISAMRAILRAKFTGDPALTQRLLDTGDALLIEGNTWGDRFWGRALIPGVRTPVGVNMLGRLLMELRDELAGHPPTRWPRAAVTGHRPQFIAPDTRCHFSSYLAGLAHCDLRFATCIGHVVLISSRDIWRIPGSAHRPRCAARSVTCGSPLRVRTRHRSATSRRNPPLRMETDTRGWACAELDRVAVKLRDAHDTRIAATGLAVGADQWWAQSADRAGLELWGYQPFPQQNSRWNTQSKAEHAAICSRLSRHVMVGDSDSDVYRDLDLRNQLLIGDVDAVVCVRDPRRTSGGTVTALNRYCPGMPVITVNLETRTTTIAMSYTPLAA
ncbi:NADAR family protein (plasmid) [Nocardia sp. NBC_01377]|uniref:NADAR family protein n=1 Tax=Nocardia sp. NBC_01377 TaxID=2903595 RepID=UPI0032433C3F